MISESASRGSCPADRVGGGRSSAARRRSPGGSAASERLQLRVHLQLRLHIQLRLIQLQLRNPESTLRPSLAETVNGAVFLIGGAFGGRANLAVASGLKALWLAYLSQPSSDRVLFRLIRKRKLRRIVEIGIGSGQRALRMISLAQRYRPIAEVRYTGIDWFEARPVDSDEGMSLKQAYRLLRGTSARIHLVPSDAHEAFARVANALSGNELVTISSDQPPETLGRIWYFLPRMLAADAAVFFARTTDETPSWRPMSLAEIRRLGTAPRRRAA